MMGLSCRRGSRDLVVARRGRSGCRTRSLRFGDEGMLVLLTPCRGVALGLQEEEAERTI